MGILFAVLGIIFIRPIASALGAEGELLENCVVYARVILAALPCYVLQLLFQSFFVTAEKPQLGLIVTVSAGLANIVLDAVLVLSFPQEYKLIGTAPIIGYNYGAQNHDELKGLLKKSIILIGLFSVGMLLAGQILAVPLGRLFVGYDFELLDMTVSGFRIFALSFLFMGYAIFGSGFFTALNDGVTSAVISFLRTLVFQIAAVLLLPFFLGIGGIWYSIVAAEFMAMVLSAIFVIVKRKQYHYGV